MKLKPEVKTAWLTALRSEEYVQTTHVLRSEDDGYCCLGVLCDQAVKDGFGNWVVSEYERAYEDPSGIFDNGIPPDSITEWAFGPQSLTETGAWRVTVKVPGEDEPIGVHLADLNDSYGYSFAMIADVIEEQM